MQGIIDFLVTPSLFAPGIVIGFVAAAGAAGFAIGTWYGRLSGTSAQSHLDREMLRMRRQNVILTEERDHYREGFDRARRRSNQKIAVDEPT